MSINQEAGDTLLVNQIALVEHFKHEMPVAALHIGKRDIMDSHGWICASCSGEIQRFLALCAPDEHVRDL